MHDGTGNFYDEAQRNAWCPDTPDVQVATPEHWHNKLNQKISLVAIRQEIVQGFMVLHADGFLDYAFVRPEQMGTGLAGQIYEKLEESARAEAMQILETEASHLFRRFLLRRGWKVDAAQHVIRNGTAIPNFRISKIFSTVTANSR